MMDADAAVNLVVQPDLAVLLVLVAGQLNSIHAQIGTQQPRTFDVLGVDCGKSDERSAIVRPTLQLRQVINRRLTLKDRASPCFLRQHVQCRQRNTEISPRLLHKGRRINLQLNEFPDCGECIAKQEVSSFTGAKQVADHREAAVSDIFKEDRRAARFVDSSLDFGCFQVRVDFRRDAHKLPRPFQVGDTLTQIPVAHGCSFRSGRGQLWDYCRLRPAGRITFSQGESISRILKRTDRATRAGIILDASNGRCDHRWSSQPVTELHFHTGIPL